MTENLDNTYGATFIGIVIAAILYGITCVQALHYYTNHNDPWYMKLTVAAVMFFDGVHQALITHSVYTYTITYWGDKNQALTISQWSVVIQIILTGLTAFIVQSFLTMRIWRLSGRNIYITSISAALVTGGLVNLIIFVVKTLQINSVAGLFEIKNLTISINVINVAADVLITATLCTLLNFSRTGFHKTEVLINRLIVFTVTTGLPASLCALASLIAILVAGNSFVYTSFSASLGRLYTSTLLATLNSRKVTTSDMSFPLGFHKDRSNPVQNITIKIDTTTQKDHPSDDGKLEENPQSPYGEGSTKVSY